MEHTFFKNLKIGNWAIVILKIWNHCFTTYTILGEVGDMDVEC